MPKATKKPEARQPEARQIAAEAVQMWCNSFTRTWLSHLDGHVSQRSLGDVFDVVERALKDEYVAKYGPVDAEDPDYEGDEIFAREAGYLIGVQVGMRLRTN